MDHVRVNGAPVTVAVVVVGTPEVVVEANTVVVVVGVNTVAVVEPTVDVVVTIHGKCLT